MLHPTALRRKALVDLGSDHKEPPRNTQTSAHGLFGDAVKVPAPFCVKFAGAATIHDFQSPGGPNTDPR